MANDREKSLASTLIFGVIGAGLVYYARRNRGMLAALSATAGYSLVTKAVSSVVIAALSHREDSQTESVSS